MPYGSVRLIPGVNVERTPTLLEASISVSQLIRVKDQLAQKLGGWEKFYPFAVGGTPRDLHAWEDLNNDAHLSVGTTTELDVITSGGLQQITPQQVVSDIAPSFTTTISDATVTVTDTNIANVTVFDAIYLRTPIAVGGLVLSGLYQITQITGTNSYNIEAASSATSSVSNGGAVPQFTTTSGSAFVTVQIVNHGVAVGDEAVFSVSTTGNGVTIFGQYTVASVVDADNFNITVANEATASSSFDMNGGDAQILYYINIGPPATGAGYGLGGYGEGGYGTGTTTTAQTGTPITATDYTSDNWGQILLACPEGGGVYQFDPTGGFSNAGLVSTAPPFNGGLFVSMEQQILVCWGSTSNKAIGSIQDQLLIKWSTIGDYSVFTPLTTNQAGSFRIPTGSMIKGGMAAPNQNLIWTDLDLWSMNYKGPPFVYGFNKIGAGAGLVSSHAMQQLRGTVAWMGPTNFYKYGSGGVEVIPCPVWDFVFQNINADFVSNVRALPNTPFNEIGWAFPSAASASGENDSYVKFNITEPGAPWDYGTLARSAWIDQTVLGPPIGTIPGGVIYQHETSNDADGQPLSASFTTGYFYIAEGEDFAFVDQIIPDFKWGTYGGAQTAQVQLTFNVVNYPGDTPTTYGPYTVTQATQQIDVRFRGRQMSITAASSDLGSFWRLGKVRYRFAAAGRR